jgi:hypothetical protein
MPIYECEECNFVNENRSLFNKHLKTRKHQRNTQPPEYSEIVIPASSQCHPNVISNIPQKSKKISQETVVYECQYCDACFTHRQNRYRHEKNSCKAKKTSDENEVLQKEIEYLREKLDEALKRIGNITNNNINNSRNLNITIKSYGKEDISYITQEQWVKLLSLPQNSVTKLFLETHFNKQHPENSNIRITNKNSKYLEVHDGERWKNRPKKKMLSEIADDKQNILDDKYSKSDEIQGEMTERQKSNHSFFHDEMYEDNKKEIIENLEGVLLDHREN